MIEIKEIFWTRLAIIDIGQWYRLEDLNGMSIDLRTAFPELGKNRKHPIQDLLYNKVADELKDSNFILVPSVFQTRIDARHEASMYHPELFPIESDERVGGFGGTT